MSKRKYHKIILLGDVGVGKTSLVLRYLNKWESQYPVIGAVVEYKHIQVPGKIEEEVIEFWDMRIHNNFQFPEKAIEKFYSGAKGVIFVFDVTNPATFNNLENHRNEFKKFVSYEVVGIVIGNKIDLSDRKISKEQGQMFSDKIDFRYFEVSAKTKENVKKSFDYIIEKLINP